MGNKHPKYDDDFYDYFIGEGGDINMAWAVADRMQEAWRARAAKETHQPDGLREAFEQWYYDEFGIKPGVFGFGTYHNRTIQGRWQAWKSAKATARESSVQKTHADYGFLSCNEHGYGWRDTCKMCEENPHRKPTEIEGETP